MGLFLFNMTKTNKQTDKQKNLQTFSTSALLTFWVLKFSVLVRLLLCWLWGVSSILGYLASWIATVSLTSLHFANCTCTQIWPMLKHGLNQCWEGLSWSRLSWLGVSGCQIVSKYALKKAIKKISMHKVQLYMKNIHRLTIYLRSLNFVVACWLGKKS